MNYVCEKCSRGKSSRHLFSRLFLPAGILLLAACARPVPPTGGQKDQTPPAVDTLRSTRNYSTRFDKRQFELTFDEWVTLQDAQAQVVVSPPLAKRPDLKLKGKTVSVVFDEKEELRPNTTYTVNFGAAIKDFHESNVAKDLRFVFSTGDFIDSLKVAGSVADALTGDALENISVMLYDVATDSVVIKERPYYFTRTDKNGEFTIRNVRAGRFKCVAIDDTDQNLKWTGEKERIGYLDSMIVVSDTSRGLVSLRLFKEPGNLRLLDRNVGRYGFARLIYSAPPGDVVIGGDVSDLKFKVERSLDTVSVWYDMPATAAWKLVAGKDTVPVKALSRDDFFKNYRLLYAEEASGAPPPKNIKRIGAEPAPEGAVKKPAALPARTVSQNPSRPGWLRFNTPLVGIDTSRWKLLEEDSIPYKYFSARIDSASGQRLRLNVGWKPGKVYQLTLLPGAVTDFYGVSNTDTLLRKFAVLTEKQLGGLNLTLNDLKPGSHYVLQLLNEKKLEDERVFRADIPEKKLVFKNLPTIAFTLRLIEDQNANGRWDSGNYLEHRQPEPVFIEKMAALRANWEIETTMEASKNKRSKLKK